MIKPGSPGGDVQLLAKQNLELTMPTRSAGCTVRSVLRPAGDPGRPDPVRLCSRRLGLARV